MQTKHTLTCDICQLKVEGSTERGANQGLGVHKRIAHGIMGKKGPQTKADRERHGVHSRGTPMQRRSWYDMVQAAKEKKARERAKEAELELLGSADLTPQQVRTLTPQQKKIRNKLRQKAWWQKQRTASNGVAHPEPTPTPQPALAMSTQAEPCKLSECPVCGSRFYVAKGKAE